MDIPVFVVTGFLDSGKTSLLNKLVSMKASRGLMKLVIQFEAGEEEFAASHYCTLIKFSKKDLDTKPKEIAKEIEGLLSKIAVDTVWIEWNGVTPLSALYELLETLIYKGVCHIEKLIHTADAASIEELLGRTGEALPEQISNSDFAVLRAADKDDDFYKVRMLLRRLNPGMRVFKIQEIRKIHTAVYRGKMSPISVLTLLVFFPSMLCLIAYYLFDLSETPINTLINVFLGIILQAIPFLIIGVLISSAIQVFITNEAIEKRIPKKLGLGMLLAILLGFCLPVCDCASVPIFRSLIKKDVPVPVAATFLCAAPVINPVVMLSTYYAFNGNLRIVAVRVGIGIVSSVVIGLIFSLRQSEKKVAVLGYDRVMCACGCYLGPAPAAGIKSKLSLFIRHSRAEFFDVGKYLMIGAFFSAVFQISGIGSPGTNSGSFALSLLIMMLIAFLLSLCSSSDAVIARSLSPFFSPGAYMGFLVFGPMMDIKNLAMLSGTFSKGFTLKLLLATFAVCYIIVFLLARPLLGV